MRFMIIRKADGETEAGAKPSQDLIRDMLNYHEQLAKSGVLLGGDGLMPSSRGARVRFTGGKPRITDGPFSEAKELIAGFTLIQAKSKEEALEWVKRWPASDGHGNVELEVRQLYELEDFDADPALKAQEERVRRQLESR